MTNILRAEGNPGFTHKMRHTKILYCKNDGCCFKLFKLNLCLCERGEFRFLKYVGTKFFGTERPKL